MKAKMKEVLLPPLFLLLKHELTILSSLGANLLQWSKVRGKWCAKESETLQQRLDIAASESIRQLRSPSVKASESPIRKMEKASCLFLALFLHAQLHASKRSKKVTWKICFKKREPSWNSGQVLNFEIQTSSLTSWFSEVLAVWGDL